MDLAKIRKKALLGQQAPLLPEVELSAMARSGQAPQARDDQRPLERVTLPGSARAAAEPLLNAFLQPLQARRTPDRSPLEIILAGRAAAGCAEEEQADSPGQVTSTGTDFEEFLCIRVSNETYGIPIMKIKEIITLRPVTEIPRAPAFVRGVISLRGMIMPVLDMTCRLGLDRSASRGGERVVVVKSGAGDSFTGLLVDQVTQVARIASNRIEAAPVTLDGIDRDFVRGIGRTENRMIILLNIETIVNIQLS